VAVSSYSQATIIRKGVALDMGHPFLMHLWITKPISRAYNNSSNVKGLTAVPINYGKGGERMFSNICGFVVLLAISIATELVVYALVRENLRALLDEVVKLPSGTTFYLRLLLIGLILIALSSVLDTTFALKPEAAFMEYVWKVTNGLSSVFGKTCLFVFGYLMLVTVLVSVLRHRHDQ